MPLIKKKAGGTLVGNIIRKSSGVITKAVSLAGASIGIPPGVTSAVVGTLTSSRPPMAQIASSMGAVAADSSVQDHGSAKKPGLFNFFTDAFEAISGHKS